MAFQAIALYETGKFVYNNILREPLLKYSKTTITASDDVLLKMCDLVFGSNSGHDKIEDIFDISRMMYCKIIRPSAVKAVEDTEIEFDDRLLKLCDTIFDCDV